MANSKDSDLRSTVIALRQLMAAYDNASFVVQGSLERIDGAAEDLAGTLRPQLRDTANGIYDLLARLETLDDYTKLRREALSE